MKLARLAPMIIACLAAASASGIAQSFRANSTWTSQQGSTLTIQSIAANGAFTGAYVNRSGGEGCQNQPYPVRGWIDGQKISFAVRWVNATENCQSITSWTGYIGPRGMLTHWVIVHLSGSGTPVLTSGKDIFH